MRTIGAMSRTDIEFLVRGGDRAALVDEFARSGAQQLQPLIRNEVLGSQEAGGEIALALFLRQHARRLREDRFGRHAQTLCARAAR
jgi:hypothetical protein